MGEGRKIAIVGAAPSSLGLAPFGDTSWEIWACSPGGREHVKRIDAWFELHDILELRADRSQAWGKPYFEWLRNLKCQVFMQEVNDLVPNAVAYPRAEIVAEFNTSSFYTSSMAWMLAKAIFDGATEIGIYGVDVSAESEYEYQRPGCKYWIEIARKRGIKVFIPDQSELDFPIPQYGFADANPMARKLKEHSFELRSRLVTMEKELAAIESRRNELISNHTRLMGALDQTTHIRRTFVAWSGPDLE